MVLALGAAADAQLLKLGTATGGMGVYYNNVDVSGAGGSPDGQVSGYDENAANQAYGKFQLGYSEQDGMYFQFDNTDLGGFSWNDVFSGRPVGSSQFGLDMISEAATHVTTGGVFLPSMDFADNVDNTVAGAQLTNVISSQSNVAWAVNDYKGGTDSGVGNGGSIINSVFRGVGVSLSIDDYRVSGTTYELDVSGWLTTDGLIHWYDPTEPGGNGDGTSNLADWGLGDSLYYEGTLIYDMDYAAAGHDLGWNTYSNGMDNGADQLDFYGGSLDVYVDVIPEPATMGLLAVGLAGMALRRRRRS